MSKEQSRLDGDDIEGLIAFLSEAGRLKDTLRSAHTENGRKESTAEHSWRLALMALVILPNFPELDAQKVLTMALIHDLGEAISGDVPAPLQHPADNREVRERRDLETILAPLGASLKDAFMSLWDDYAGVRTAEAKLVKALDKLETILQHVQGQNPPDFNYEYNMTYGTQATDALPTTKAIRTVLDQATGKRLRAPEA